VTDHLASPSDLERARARAQARRAARRARVTVCGGTGCQAAGCREVAETVRREVARRSLEASVDVVVTGCHGFCEQGPIVVVRPSNVFYPRVTPARVADIVERTVVRGEPVEGLLFRDPVSKKRIAREDDIPFYSRQRRLVFAHNGTIDPESLDDYLAVGGYGALAKALFEMTPEQVIEQVDRSGLRGRGGAGFPTGRKWASCRAAPGPIRYVICNADEGDPGAFMDRSLLEGNPHAVLEGMLIGARAIGSTQGWVYVRHEYPLAVRNLGIALEQARAAGLLGERILGSDLSFDVRVSRGGGAFVCGESTALMASLEGRTGEPRAKYVHTVEHGLWDRPSNLNNVETWANVPLIVERGADFYASIGTQGSKGTKIFSLVGKIHNTGLVEVPMGTTLRDVVFGIGGGIPKKKRFKAVQTGGPSGGCLPEKLLELPVDFDRLTEAGSMMGSGGMIVMDEDTCMVDVARYFVRFLADESCGKCVPCREGLRTVLAVLERITRGRGRADDIDLLEQVGAWMTQASLCALGGSAANPVSSTIRYFRDEYDAHIRDRRCPAGVCKDLVTYGIDPERCNGCGLCVPVCADGLIRGERKKLHTLEAERCVKCGACYAVCNRGAILRG
jgi:NADH-quinone oxidoreductase subunit F